MWSIQIILISVILIFLIHHIIHFLKSTLTIPKIKDLVHSPLQKYEHIIQNMSNNNTSPKPDRDAMKNELKTFLKNQLKKDDTTDTTDISSLEFYGGQNTQELGAPL
jgi:uncharacterized membrane protein